MFRSWDRCHRGSGDRLLWRALAEAVPTIKLRRRCPGSGLRRCSGPGTERKSEGNRRLLGFRVPGSGFRDPFKGILIDPFNLKEPLMDPFKGILMDPQKPKLSTRKSLPSNEPAPQSPGTTIEVSLHSPTIPKPSENDLGAWGSGLRFRV